MSASASESSLGVHVWLVLFKAYQAIRIHDQKSIESSGLCFSDFATLEILLHKGPLPVNTIGDKVGLTSGSITTGVDRLEKKGLVTRETSTTDRRVRTVHLTDPGRRLIEMIFVRHQEALEQATSGLDEAEKTQLIGLLKKLGKHAASLQ